MTETLAAALSALQAKLPEVRKSETADVQTQKGSYSYRYAALATISAAVMPLMAEHGLSFIARPSFVDGRYVLACTLLHTSGEREEAEYPLPVGGTPQAIGSAITYGRRYCLCAMTGVAPEADDDGAAAEAEAARTAGTAQRQRPPVPPEPTAQRLGASTLPAAQRAKMMALFTQVGIGDRAERLRLSAAIVGRPDLPSANALTHDEARRLIDVLDAAIGQEDPAGWLAELSTPDTAEDEPE
jgi:hypothetical protein